MHVQPISVPDFSKELTTSSIVLAKNMEDAPQQLTPRQQMEQPFTIGGQKITPTFTPAFAKSGELLFVFLIYNVGGTPEGKPDIDVGYTVSRGEEAKPFAKMPTTSFNGTTLPAEFNLNAGHQVMVAQGVPLASFAPGEYKLGIGITDKTKNQTITRTVPFHGQSVRQEAGAAGLPSPWVRPAPSPRSLRRHRVERVLVLQDETS